MLSREEIIGYLDDPSSWDALAGRARAERSRHFGDGVFAYGFDYFSTHCRNACAFCLYRAGNGHAPRYRHGEGEVVRACGQLAHSGVHALDLTMGEDPSYLDHPERLVELVREVAGRTGLPVMVSPGMVADEQVFRRLRDAGAVWFALYQETFCREQFARLRIGQDFDERLAAKRAAREAGLLVEEGMLVGWGDTAGQIAESLVHMRDADPSQVRVMTFVPQAGTPLEHAPAQSSARELAVISLLRIMYPDLLIPASLDVEGPAGLRARLDAGANVVTSIIPPGAGLEGVARNADIEDGARTLSQIMPIIQGAGLKLASQADYESYVTSRRGVSPVDHGKSKERGLAGLRDLESAERMSA